MNRRDLINFLAAGIAIPLAPISISAASIKSGKRLILVELSGANDGLNTVIPIKDERYGELRPRIKIDRSKAFNLGNGLVLNSAMRSLDGALQAGDLAIMQGLGYPGQNRSHFKSIALWETGGDGTKSGKNGWLTEDIEQMTGSDQLDAHGISLDGGMGIFASPSGVWLSMTSLGQFSTLQKKLVIPNQTLSSNPALSFVLDRAHALNSSMQSISSKISRLRNKNLNINAGDFGKQASMAAYLIDAGISAPVLKLKIGSFDTHENQTWRHRRLLQDLSKGLSGLRRALIQSGHWDNTLIMTYSEFGRRAKENESGGTDHGTAAPHFLMSGSLEGGLWGIHPDLGNLTDGDVKFTTDYRVVYDKILSDWFGLDQNRFQNYRSNITDGLFS
ncbi:MAG: DUF1501 domain-containing protein [Amylibacter sp.]|jgi:uncharacterized protein (DUF1501 family)|tara:strand:- start:93 stop:1259 length:1167 start_codon:yes stop_codon:yes gene_type:complete